MAQPQISVGRRKESVARVRLSPGTGNIVINGRTMDAYFGRETSKMILVEPLKLVDQMGKLDVLVNAAGGGLSGQAGATRHGRSPPPTAPRPPGLRRAASSRRCSTWLQPRFRCSLLVCPARLGLLRL